MTAPVPTDGVTGMADSARPNIPELINIALASSTINGHLRTYTEAIHSPPITKSEAAIMGKYNSIK
jgi:hypothetical protein